MILWWMNKSRPSRKNHRSIEIQLNSRIHIKSMPINIIYKTPIESDINTEEKNKFQKEKNKFQK